ncbi:MAG TPA: YraN family protein [Candidatus Methylacidiphilales bacterium]
MPLPFTDLVQFIGDRLGRYENKPAPNLLTAREIGIYGERTAAVFLRRHGYRILYRNYRTTGGEIDLICRDTDVLVFVEVRTRGSTVFGHPVESIGADKQENLRYAAQRYLELLDNPPIFYRFDAVEVMLNKGEIPVCTLQRNLFS